MEGCSIPQDARLRRVGEGIWEIPDSTPSCRVVRECENRVDVYEAGGPLPQAGWKQRSGLLRGIKELVEKSKECREWLETRLEHKPNFFMPAPFWRKLGLDAEAEETDRVSLPHNTELSEPKFLHPLSLGLLYVLAMVAKWWGGEPARPAEGTGGWFEPSEAPGELVERLDDLQEREEFYDLWSVLRGTSGARFTGISREYKNIEIFEPIEEAALQHHSRGKLTDLSKAYSDLLKDERNSVEELKKAIREGEYDLRG